MTETVDYYENMLDAFRDTESLTVLVASGVSRDEAVGVLGIELDRPVDGSWDNGDDYTGWALVDVPGGVLAIETTGYGDPSTEALGLLSKNGAAGVVRSNIQARMRFGCARGSEVLFDDDGFMYVDDPTIVPAELRQLFALAWIDLDDEDDFGDGGPSPFAVALAMVEAISGVKLTEDLVASVFESGFFRAPNRLA